MRKDDVSIVMIARNASNTIDLSIQSILDQSFSQYEFIIVDDGSTDDTVKHVKKFSDKRIKLIEKQHNYIDSLNMAIQLASCDYVARMDADDFMHPDRILVQLQFMKSHPNIDICGTWMRTFGNNHTEKRTIESYIYNPILKLLERNFLYHPTIMWKTKFFQDHKLKYKHGYDLAEDYKLWSDAAFYGANFFIIPYCLHYYRLSSNQNSYKHNMIQKKSARFIQLEILRKLHFIYPKQINQIIQQLVTLHISKIININDLLAILHLLKNKYLINNNTHYEN